VDLRKSGFLLWLAPKSTCFTPWERVPPWALSLSLWWLFWLSSLPFWAPQPFEENSSESERNREEDEIWGTTDDRLNKRRYEINAHQ